MAVLFRSDKLQVTGNWKCTMIGTPIQGGTMKRLLPIAPVFLFIFLNACATDASAIAPPVGTAVGQTQTATMWTPTSTPIPDPNEPKIVEWLNEGLSAADSLEKSLDANYQARDVFFPGSPASAPTVFRVDVRCDCAFSTQCCVPERMFVVTMLAMKNRADKVVEQVPASVGEVKVVCFQHEMQIAVLAASWSDVKGYLLDQINGFQLGSRVYRSAVP